MKLKSTLLRLVSLLCTIDRVFYKITMSRKATTGPLSGHQLAISGRFPGGATQRDLEQRICNLRGVFKSKVTADTTILIASQKDFQTPSIKVVAATENGIPIVSLEWLEQTESSGAKADENQYLLSSSTSQPTSAPALPSAPAAANGKKRAASPSIPPGQDQTGSQAKKQKKVDDDAEKDKPKIGDGGNAKSTRIEVPVDEYCPLLNSHRIYIDDDGLIWDASLNQTNASANNNKFYKVQVSTKQIGPLPLQLTRNSCYRVPMGQTSERGPDGDEWVSEASRPCLVPALWQMPSRITRRNSRTSPV